MFLLQVWKRHSCNSVVCEARHSISDILCNQRNNYKKYTINSGLVTKTYIKSILHNHFLSSYKIFSCGELQGKWTGCNHDHDITKSWCNKTHHWSCANFRAAIFQFDFRASSMTDIYIVGSITCNICIFTNPLIGWSYCSIHSRCLDLPSRYHQDSHAESRLYQDIFREFPEKYMGYKGALPRHW